MKGNFWFASVAAGFISGENRLGIRRSLFVLALLVWLVSALAINSGLRGTAGMAMGESSAFQQCPVITVSPASLPAARVGQVFSANVTASGSVGPYTFSRVSGTLPPGLSFSPTGSLSGTPTTAGRFSFVIRAADRSGECSGQREYAITVEGCSTITVSPGTLPTARVAAGIIVRFTATGGIAPYSFSRVTGTLPPGLSFSPDGALSGTPTLAGRFNFAIQATDGGGCTGRRDYTLVVDDCELTIDPPTLPIARVATGVDARFTATGGTGPFTYRVAAGAPPPPGLTLSPEGVLAGTPTQAGEFPLVVEVTNTGGCSGRKAYTLIIERACPTITVVPPTITVARAGAVLNLPFTASGGTGPYTFNRVTGTLPPGLTLSPAGVLAGTPTQEGSFPVDIEATDANGCVGRKAYTLLIERACPTITVGPPTITVARAGAVLNLPLTASGGTGPYTFNRVTGTLPPGLTLSPAGVLAGTPTQAGNFPVDIEATDANGCVGRQAYTLVIEGVCLPITVGPPTLPVARAGAVLNLAFTASGGTGPYSFSITTPLIIPPFFPPGASLLTREGVFRGTPQRSGLFNFTIETTDANGCTGRKEYQLTVEAGTRTVSGKVLSCLTPSVPVPSVVLTRRSNTSDEPPVTTTTNGAGEYSLAAGNCLPECPRVTPSLTLRPQDVNGITSLDAAITARAAAGILQFTPCQQLAGDANGNGAVTSLDAAQIARAAAGILQFGPTTPIGTVKHSMPIKEIPPGEADVTDFNFDALLVGDVNGSWRPPPFFPPSTLNGFAESLEVRVPRVQLPISLPTLAANNGASLTIPLNVGGTLTAQDDIIAYDLVVTYDPAVLKLQATPVDAAGTLSSGLTLTTNPSVAGQLTVSAFGVNAIVGTGTLLNLKFDVIGAAGTSSVLKIQKLVFNDDAQTNLTDGKVTIPGAVACPTVADISPASGNVNSTVTINGTNFTGISGVKFSNNVTAIITGNTATQLMVTVPAAAVTGPLTISKAGCPDITTAPFTVTVACPTITVNPATVANATINQAYSVSFTATGGTAPYQFTLAAGGLPNGLTLPTSGVLTGAPTVTGTFNFTVSAKDANNCTGTRAYSLTVSGVSTAPLASVSAANYKTPLTPEMIVAGFGLNLASGVAVASTATLPTTLLGTTASVTDSLGTVRPVSLFFVSPGQVNYLMPAGMPDGNATVTITSGSGAVSSGTAVINRVSPGIFTSNATGAGVPSALALRVSASGALTYEPIANNALMPTPIDLGPESEQVFLVLFLTGARFNSGLSGVTADIGGVSAPVLYAGAQGSLFGLDQMNIRLPRTLIGRGPVDLTTTVDGKVTNKVQIQIK